VQRDRTTAPDGNEPIDPSAEGDDGDFEADSDGDGRSPHAVQRVTWAELFFDLVYVFAVTQVAHAVSISGGWQDVARSLLLFAPFWWSWVGTTILFNGLVISATRRHLLLFAIGGAAFVMCIAVPYAFGNRGVLFGTAYFGVRVLLGLAMRSRGLFKPRFDPYTVALLVGPAWILGGLAPEGTRQWIWLAAAVIELSVPIVLGHRLDYMQFDASHLPERFGLFIIIALGETLVGIGQGGTRSALHGLGFVTLIIAFLFSCGLWWTYFQYGASAAEHALRTARVPAILVRSMFSYGHLAFVVGIILIAGGVTQAVTAPSGHPHGFHSVVLGLGTALYIATFCYTRVMMFGGASWTRLITALLAAVIGAVSPGLPAIVPLALLTALVTAMNAFELYWVTTQRPLLVLKIGTGAAGN
jgi:low temperature requirement protein LtrA